MDKSDICLLPKDFDIIEFDNYNDLDLAINRKSVSGRKTIRFGDEQGAAYYYRRVIKS